MNDMIAYIIKKNLMTDFAELLKTSREKWKPKKISLKKLAEAIGNICSDAYLSQLENRRYMGKKGNLMRPDKEIVIALARVFNWNLNEALTLAGHSPLPGAPEYQTEVQIIANRLAGGVMASGFDDLEDEDLREDFLADMQTIAESMLKRKLEEQKKRKIK